MTDQAQLSVTPESSKCFELIGVSRYYGERPALDRLSLSISAGDCLFLLGRNGAGKSTLQALLSGVSRASEGQIFFESESYVSRETRARLRTALGYVSQKAFLYPDLSIVENLRLIAECSRCTGDAVERVLLRLGLMEHRQKRLRECSQGMVRRAALARALVHAPRILILDEPLANLDIESQEGLCRILEEEKRRGVTFVISSHEEKFIQNFASSVLLLENGRIVSSSRDAQEISKRTFVELVDYLLENKQPIRVQPERRS